MSALGCTFGGVFSFPIAIFILCSYLLSGTLGNFILSSNSLLENNSIRIKMGVFLSQTILKFISPIQKFQSSDYLANGILLNNAYIIMIIEKFFIIQIIVVIVFGIFIFNRRELGKVVKK